MSSQTMNNTLQPFLPSFPPNSPPNSPQHHIFFLRENPGKEGRVAVGQSGKESVSSSLMFLLLLLLLSARMEFMRGMPPPRLSERLTPPEPSAQLVDQVLAQIVSEVLHMQGSLTPTDLNNITHAIERAAFSHADLGALSALPPSRCPHLPSLPCFTHSPDAESS